MNKLGVGIVVGILVTSTLAYAAVSADIINWGFGGIIRNKEWVAPDGRMSMQNQTVESTSIDLWGAPTLPNNHSISEITLHRNSYGLGYDERLNVSAMSQANQSAYRVGVERSGSGSFRDIIFCFEDVTPGVAVCPLKITMQGVLVNRDLAGGYSWEQL